MPTATTTSTATRTSGTGAAALAVSVVVPTCGRPELLERCLEALARQSLPGACYELIVVDDRPSEQVRQRVAAWGDRVLEHGLHVTYIPNHGPHGPAAARNRGWHAARAPIVAFTDDDTVPSRTWLATALASFGDEVDAMCGRIEMPLPDVPTDYERDAAHLQSAEFVTANCLCRKRVLEQIGGFDERFTRAWREDSDLHFRLLKHGARIVHAPQVLVVHPVRPAPWGVSLTQTRKIAFDALLYKKHPELYREKIRATPRWDYYLIVTVLLVALVAAVAGWPMLAAFAGAVWLALTLRLCALRLAGNVKTVSQVTEMLVTSALIPPVAVFWRLAGAIRYRVCFV